MYASVVCFDQKDEPRALSERKYYSRSSDFGVGGDRIDVTVMDLDGWHELRVRWKSLGGRTLFWGLVRDGTHVRVKGDRGRYWSIAVSRYPIDIDTSDKGTLPELNEDIIVPRELRHEVRQGGPMKEVAAPTVGPTAPFRRIEDSDGSDIRYIGFSQSDSTVEIWRLPGVSGIYQARYTHHGMRPLSREKAKDLSARRWVSAKQMQTLLSAMLEAGLASLYSFYKDYRIIDGGGWGMEICASDGYIWNWGGSNAYPKGYSKLYGAVFGLVIGDEGSDWWEDSFGDAEADKPELWHICKNRWWIKDAAKSLKKSICRDLRQDVPQYVQRHPLVWIGSDIEMTHGRDLVLQAENGDCDGWTSDDAIQALAYVISIDDAEQQLMVKLAYEGTLERILEVVRVVAYGENA